MANFTKTGRIEMPIEGINKMSSKSGQNNELQSYSTIGNEEYENQSVLPSDQSMELLNSTLGICNDESDTERMCWICLGTEYDCNFKDWLHPCKCRGSTKWVHEICLYYWVNEKQQGNELLRVCCQQCKAPYIMRYTQLNMLARILEIIDNTIDLISPYVASGIVVSSWHWSTAKYGKAIFLEVIGHKRGLAIMENVKPLTLSIGLRLIPLTLILCQLIPWENGILYIMHNWRNILHKIPLINLLVSSGNGNQYNNRGPGSLPSSLLPRVSTPCMSRILCGGLILPMISTIVGRILFRSVDNSGYRILLGGLTYITVKGILKLYLRQQQYTRKIKRQIVDYTDDNILKYGIPLNNERENENVRISQSTLTIIMFLIQQLPFETAEPAPTNVVVLN